MGLVNPGNANPEDVRLIFFFSPKNHKQTELRSHQMKHIEYNKNMNG